MAHVTLDEDSIDDIMYLSRVNEASELDAYLSKLSTQTKHPKADLVVAAIDGYTKNSSLHYAAANGHTDVIKLLLSYNPDKATTSSPGLINTVNDSGNTPLHWAALNGHLESVKLLIQLGADVTIINKAGHDAVFEAEINDKKDVVEWLLGAVEELEKGVGQGGEASGDAGEDDGMEMDHEADKNSSSGVGEVSTTRVDDVTKRIEGMKTKDDGCSQGG
ncbi:ankyrin [Zopfia rhizophila CBS 207.26]|uniref:Ankyrin n=1 Tax=Zopfia rhizophila CBS 207.26 TaxID=1314779 RepID=A0A6A6DNG9_9PEZI|nr:ankyrin [Zopfia rhizophila CBS 207.26]